MNIAKKILFGLLLSASVFTAACGEGDSNKLKEGKEGCEVGSSAKAEKMCDDGLTCVAMGTKTQCLKECKTDASVCKTEGYKNCADGTKKEGNAKSKFCQAAPAAGTVAPGSACVANSTKPAEMCTAEGVCHNALCMKKCTTVAAGSSECSGTTPDCVEKDGMKFCDAPAGGTVALGQTCVQDSTKPAEMCVTGLKCLNYNPGSGKVYRCMNVCESGSNCGADKGGYACITGVKEGDTDVRACFEGAAGAGADCNDTGAPDKSCAANHICVKAATDDAMGTCVAVCDKTDAGACGGDKTQCKPPVAPKVAFGATADVCAN